MYILIVLIVVFLIFFTLWKLRLRIHELFLQRELQRAEREIALIMQYQALLTEQVSVDSLLVLGILRYEEYGGTMTADWPEKFVFVRRPSVGQVRAFIAQQEDPHARCYYNLDRMLKRVSERENLLREKLYALELRRNSSVQKSEQALPRQRANVRHLKDRLRVAETKLQEMELAALPPDPYGRESKKVRVETSGVDAPEEKELPQTDPKSATARTA